MDIKKRQVSNKQGKLELFSVLSHNKRLSSLALCMMIATGSSMMVACGSSEADGSADPIDRSESESRPGLEEIERGQFVDSAVSGLFYQTDSQEGFTDHNGYFNYSQGEVVSFSIGNIELGSAPAEALLTPVHISQGATGNSETLNDASINILRLLQTLDTDGDPSNGISISESTHIVAAQLSAKAINVKMPVDSFEKSPALIQFIGQVTNVSSLVENDRAIEHFRETQALYQ